MYPSSEMEIRIFTILTITGIKKNFATERYIWALCFQNAA